MKSVLVLNENGFWRDSRVRRECQSLLEAGFKVDIITIPEPDAPSFEIPSLSFHYLHFPSGAGTRGFFPKLLRFLGGNKEYLRLAKPLSFDIIHANDLDSLPAAVKLKKKTGAKLVYDSHELFSEQIPRSRSIKNELFRAGFKIFFRILEGILIKHADVIITVNESIAFELSRRYTISKPIVVMNCPSLREKPKEYRGGENPFLLAFPQIRGKKILLYNGGISKGRGLEKLVEAMAFIEEAVLIFMGKGDIEKQLKDMVCDLKLTQKVFFHPPVPSEQVLIFSQWADVGLLPFQNCSLNIYFSLPNKLFEYLMAGLPVVSPDLPELRKVVEENGFGVLFNPRQKEGIIPAIEKILEPKTFEEAKKRVLEKATELFNWEKEEKKLIQIYQFLQK